MRPIMITSRHRKRRIRSADIIGYAGSCAESKIPMRTIDCPICQVNHAKPYRLFGYDEIVQCEQCGLIYVNPQRDTSDTKNYFQKTYIPDARFLDQELGLWRLETLEREAKLITERKPPGRILDVGCAGGDLLSIMAAFKWDCYGVEPAVSSVSKARNRGFQVYEGLFSEITFPQKNFFDVVTYLDALPFSATPAEDLKTIYSLLKRDGLLLIEIPGLAYRVIRNVGPISLLRYGRWSHLSPDSRHFFYYSTRTLAQLLKKNGFEIRQIVLEQALMRNHRLFRQVNQIHFTAARLCMRLSLGKLNVAAKVVYVCTKS